jgi:hypothetical protein
VSIIVVVVPDVVSSVIPDMFALSWSLIVHKTAFVPRGAPVLRLLPNTFC